MKHYVRKNEDDSLTYIGRHEAKPREAFGPHIPEDLLEDKYTLKYSVEEGELGGEEIVFSVDAAKKATRDSAEAAEADAAQARRDALDAARGRILAAKEKPTLTATEVKDLLLDVVEVLGL